MAAGENEQSGTGANGSQPTVSPSFAANLKGKTGIVTGSARGIGAGIAIELGRRGASVVVNYTSATSEAKAAAVVAEIQKAGSKAVAVQGSVVHAADRSKLVDAALALSSTAHIDLLVHNAANGDDRLLANVDEAFFDELVSVNLRGPLFLTQAVVPHMARGGRIVLISSAAARMGVAETTVYAATKAGNEAFARVWATELGQSQGITVNCVNPGPIATDGYYSSTPEFIDSMQPMIESTPAEARVGEVRDIAPLVSFLCSEESRWVTGSVVSGSGGLLIF
ncbi:Short-chain type dehydrogenase/reductase [Cercospora beticola]|uniref:Short-chain type dehydrogenase/reductase n=1 Tax=Cercospora beticola TaxID=122368 RepID=A0A2G5HMS6_CERBT|nr:Short-chain type dehydrogenase/reductase [Cercospora beticola]PIA93866.1 Short-chain type dehydrogenase/reductase [Cercospora beticola]WPB02344.1 hypothetical protein RHO25_006978 [Cercospora beticola]